MLQWVGSLGLGTPFLVGAVVAVCGVAVGAIRNAPAHAVTVGTLAVVLLMATLAGVTTWGFGLRSERDEARKMLRRGERSTAPRSYDFIVYAGDDPEAPAEAPRALEWAEPASNAKAHGADREIGHEVGEHVNVRCVIRAMTGDLGRENWFALSDGDFMPASTIRRRPFSGASAVSVCPANPREAGDESPGEWGS